MKYGFTEQLSIMNDSDLITFDNTHNTSSSGYDMTSSFLLSESSLSYVDRAVQDIIGKDNTDNSNHDKNVMKFIIDRLHEQIKTMRE